MTGGRYTIRLSDQDAELLAAYGRDDETAGETVARLLHEVLTLRNAPRAPTAPAPHPGELAAYATLPAGPERWAVLRQLYTSITGRTP